MPELLKNNVYDPYLLYDHYRNREKYLWTSALGQSKYIKDLNDSHIINIINSIINGSMAFSNSDKVIEYFKLELIYRANNGISISNNPTTLERNLSDYFSF